MSDLFLTVFNRAMAAGWLILAVLVLRLVLRKAPKWIRCVLWALAAVRLACPFSLESVLSLVPSAEVLAPETLYDPTPAVHTGVASLNTAINQSFTPAMTPAELTSVNPLQVWTWLAGWVWVLGMAALLVYALASWLRLRKRVAASVEEDGLWRCDGIHSPFILGVFRPRIYVPSDLAGEDLAYVTAHEQAHLKRKDHWWKPLGYLLLTVYWFHPLVWAAYVLLCRDIELACDEKVVRDLDGDEKKAYSQALVTCAVSRRTIAACPVAFGEVGVRQRVKSVLHYKKPAFWVILLALVLCMAVAVCFLTNPVTFTLEFAREDIARVETMDLRLNSGDLTGELSEAQTDELWNRLQNLEGSKQTDAYGGSTPFYSVSIQLTDGQWIKIRGYALDGSKVDLVQGDDVYQINDEEFQAYLDGLCAGGNKTEAATEDVQTVEVPDPLADGSVYISTECVFLNPLSSAVASADSGYYYTIHGSTFSLVRRSSQAAAAIQVKSWQWQDWPFTEDAWAEKFWITPVDVSGYTERLYLPLNEDYYLLSLDGRLWLVDDHGDSKTGIWSIHALERAENLVTARWSYMDGVDGEHLPMVLKFEMEYDQLRLNCDQGQIFGATTNVNYEDKIYYAGQTETIYWTALNEDGTTAPDEAEITFAIVKDDVTLAEGVLTLDRQGQCGIEVSGTPPTGAVSVMDADGSLLFIASLPAAGPRESTLADYLESLTPSEIGHVSWAGVREAPSAEELLAMVQRACENLVETEPFLEYWSLEAYAGGRAAGMWSDDDAIRLQVGLVEPVIHITAGENLPAGDLCVADEELYWFLRTAYDTEPRGVDQDAYEAYKDWLVPLLNSQETLPAVAGDVVITKELTGLVLADSSEKLHAQAYEVDIVWNVEPKEKAFDLLAGGARVDSELRIHGMNAASSYLIVMDGEPVGFVGWWFLLDKTLDDQFETREALLEAVKRDG